MKKIILISLLSIVGLSIIYFLIIKPLGIFGSVQQKLEQRILELGTLSNAGVNSNGYTKDEWIRRTAIKQLLMEGKIELSDLTNASQGGINALIRQIPDDVEWIAKVIQDVEAGRFTSIDEGIFSNAVYFAWTSEDNEFEIK